MFRALREGPRAGHPTKNRKMSTGATEAASDEPVIRNARADDMANCAAIFNDWVDATPWMPRVHDHDDVVRHYREDVYRECEVMVAEVMGTIGGFLALSDSDFVSSLYVQDKFCGRGLGKRLLDQAKARRPAGLSLWTFVANDGARRFYAREGFREVRRTDGDNEEQLPDVLLHWSGSQAT